MGLIDRWVKKTEKAQLQNATATETSGKVVAAPTAARKKSVSAATKKDGSVKQSLMADKILVRSLITEKSAVAQGLNKYSFAVKRTATKNQVKQAVLEAYGVTPTRINLINVSGRAVRFGRLSGRRSDYKKAVVTLPPGKSIAVHEGV